MTQILDMINTQYAHKIYLKYSNKLDCFTSSICLLVTCNDKQNVVESES